MIDTRAWLLWAVALAVAATVTRNPLYLVLLLLVAAVVERRSQRRGVELLSSPRFALFVMLSTTLLNGLTAHVGATELFELPIWVPLLGGPFTLEAALFGATNGLVLAVIFGAFAATNRAVPPRELVRLAPRGLQDAGVVVAIALAFVPETTRSLTRIREAQAVRGHRDRGLRDWPPIAVPLVIGGLERSTGLAEAMVARGYGSVADRPFATPVRVATALGLVALLAGWLGALFFPAVRDAGVVLAALGATLLVGGVWLAGRDLARTRYRPRHWGWRETAVAIGAVCSLAGLLAPLPFVDLTARLYSPYPLAGLPPFDPTTGLLLLGLLVPALLAGTDSSSRDGDIPTHGRRRET